MKLEEFEDLCDYPKHNIALSILGIFLIVSYTYITIIKGTQIAYCVPLLWVGVRIYHFSFLGYNDLLVTIYYTYLEGCVKRGISKSSYTGKCVEKYKQVPFVKRYTHSFYKSTVSGLHNILTMIVIGIILVSSSYFQVFLLDSKASHRISTNSTNRFTLNSRLMATARLLDELYSDVDYEVIYGVYIDNPNDGTKSYLENKPQIGIVRAVIQQDGKKIECVLYIDAFLNEIVAATQQFDMLNKEIVTYKKDMSLQVIADDYDITNGLLEVYPNFRMVRSFREFKIYD